MIRGVNKRIVEVSGGGSRYFDKALLFVRPEFADIPTAKLETDARQYLDNLEQKGAAPLPPYRSSRRADALRRRKIIGRVLLGILITAAVIGYTVFIKSL